MTARTRTPGVSRALPMEHRERFMGVAREVSFPPGARLFEEGGRADRFWIIRSGTVELDMHVPGCQAAAIEPLRPTELERWPWLFTPHVWHPGAEAASPVRADEFDATAARPTCQEDPAPGDAVARWAGDVLAHRLRSARTRLLDPYAPYGAGSHI